MVEGVNVPNFSAAAMSLRMEGMPKKYQQGIQTVYANVVYRGAVESQLNQKTVTNLGSLEAADDEVGRLTGQLQKHQHGQKPMFIRAQPGEMLPQLDGDSVWSRMCQRMSKAGQQRLIAERLEANDATTTSRAVPIIHNNPTRPPNQRDIRDFGCNSQ